MKSKITLTAAILAFVSLVSACGGGGSSSSSPAATTPAVTSTPQMLPSVVTSVAAPTYASADNIDAFNLLNSLRNATGVGALAEDTNLDKAALAHTSFIINNNLLSNTAYLTTPGEGLHWEDSSLPGFTGATPEARAMAAGFNGDASESVAAGEPSGTACVHALVEDTVYHRANLLSSATNVGLSFTSNAAGQTVCVINSGAPQGILGQWPADIITYPYNGQTNVDTTFIPVSETPNPAPDLSSAGIPVMISLYAQSTLPTVTSSLTASNVTVTQFVMTNLNGATVSARILTVAGVNGTGLTTDAELTSFNIPGVIFLLPISPLLPNTTYNVAFAGTVNGIAVAKSWSFQTGASN